MNKFGKIFNFILEPDLENEENFIICNKNYFIIDKEGNKEKFENPFKTQTFLEKKFVNFFGSVVNKLEDTNDEENSKKKKIKELKESIETENDVLV